MVPCISAYPFFSGRSWVDIAPTQRASSTEHEEVRKVFSFNACVPNASELATIATKLKPETSWNWLFSDPTREINLWNLEDNIHSVGMISPTISIISGEVVRSLQPLEAIFQLHPGDPSLAPQKMPKSCWETVMYSTSALIFSFNILTWLEICLVPFKVAMKEINGVRKSVLET